MLVLSNEVLALFLHQISHLNASFTLVHDKVKTYNLINGAYSKLSVLLKTVEENETQETSPNRVTDGTE